MSFLNKIHPLNGSRGGLTVAEFLVIGGIVLFIATIIIVWLVVRVQSFQETRRDETREIHIKQLLQALIFYQSNVGNYPYPSENEVINGTTDTVSKALKESRILIEVPVDPLNRGNYIYKYTSGNGATFRIDYYLETDTISGKRKGLNSVYP